MHAKATVNGTLLAETDSYEFIEGNVYFPPSSLTTSGVEFVPTKHSTHCPWKGDASYYDVKVNGQTLENAAWYYPQALDKAKGFEGFVAFYKTKVKVEKE
ncbi:hypothetical protein LTR62_000193 [Meristemomyces frigidus]|uniref:DUF427 domain-containing protein n=1 Tax=Meristemomyces frigidus TaxID=1508187 RepID=A0AAN7TQF0_9PEZI|nr:hypothetical protein LTR62_000193 [Meristemomyces frigidus]